MQDGSVYFLLPYLAKTRLIRSLGLKAAQHFLIMGQFGAML